MANKNLNTFKIESITEEAEGRSIKVRADRNGQMATVRLSPDKVDNAHVKEKTMFVQSGDAFMEFICRSSNEALTLSKWLMGEGELKGPTDGVVEGIQERQQAKLDRRVCGYCGTAGEGDPRAWVHALECPECVEMRTRIQRVTANAWQLICDSARAGELNAVTTEKAWSVAHLHETASIRLHMEAHDKRLADVKEERDRRFGQPHFGHDSDE